MSTPKGGAKPSDFPKPSSFPRKRESISGTVVQTKRSGVGSPVKPGMTRFRGFGRIRAFGKKSGMYAAPTYRHTAKPNLST